MVNMMNTKLPGEQFWSYAEMSPAAPALVIGARTTSYGELAQAAERMRRVLVDRGIGPGSRVAVISERCELLFTALLAIRSLDASFFVLSPLDSERTRFAIAAVQPRALIARRQIAVDAGLDSRFFYHLDPEGEWVVAEFPTHEDAPGESYLMMTSGSSGEPKIVRIGIEALSSALSNAKRLFKITPSDRLSQTFEPTFDLFLFDFFMALDAGACLVVILKDQLWSTMDICYAHGVTVWFSVPTFGTILVRSGQLRCRQLPPLRHVLFCGEALSCELARQWQGAFPQARLFNLYGPTELTIYCSAYELTSPLLQQEGVISIGRLNLRCDGILVNEHLDVSEDISGELCVAGDQQMTGYLSSSVSADRKLFYHTNRRYYRTGDRVLVDDRGYMFYLGRVDRELKLNGHRIAPEEVETALRSISCVHQAAVVAARNSLLNTRELVAFYVTNTDTLASEVDIINAVSRIIPPYMRPKKAIRLEHMPVSKSGKINYSALMQTAETMIQNVCP